MPVPGDPILEEKISLRNQFTAYCDLAVKRGILNAKYAGGYPEGVLGRTHLAAALRYDGSGKFRDLPPEERRRYAERIFDIHAGTTADDWRIILGRMETWLVEKLGPAATNADSPAVPTPK